jgi:enoyl-CoA hydratase
MNHEGHAQLYVRLTTENFEESVRARAAGRKPVFTDHRNYGHELDSE